LNELTQQIFSDYSYSFKEKGVICELNLSAKAIPIKVDIQAFEEALSNLIENAIKYSPQDKIIKISTSIEGEFGCCQVSDFGIGISKNDQKQIFDKFYRVEGALIQKTKGTGLGLSLVEHIMESHHGKVTVFSQLDKGSIFTLKFPLKNPL